MHLLHVHSSPRQSESHSYRLAQHFLAHLEERVTPLAVDRWDLFAEALPAVDERFLAVKAKAAAGGELSNPERVLWSRVEAAIGRIRQADALLFSLPMWNFGSPYVFKQFIDVVTQHGYLFEYGADGPRGLLGNMPALAILARGGDYRAGAPAAAMDQQTDYLRTIFGFWGISSPRIVAVQPTLGDVEAKETAYREAKLAVEGFAASMAGAMSARA
ncbi:MAG: FMN-dependent NADH-azoreductase [Verrucomicrobiota bacterium]